MGVTPEERGDRLAQTFSGTTVVREPAAGAAPQDPSDPTKGGTDEATGEQKDASFDQPTRSGPPRPPEQTVVGRYQSLPLS